MQVKDVKLGSCCACGREDETCRNIVMLSVRAPVPGAGWGCVVCGLPLDGAIAVLCDACMKAKREPKWVVYGMAASGERVLLSTCVGVFEHREEMHVEGPVL